MGILRKKIKEGLVGLSFLFAVAVAAAVRETKARQYNQIVEQVEPVFGCAAAEVLDKVQKSHREKDNKAAIRIGSKTYVIASSIIDGILYDYLKLNNTNSLPNTRPISVMDLLYLYNNIYDGIITDGDDLEAKVQLARGSSNRALVTEMMKTVVQQFETQKKTIFAEVGPNTIEKGEVEVKLQKANKVISPTTNACKALGRLIHLVQEKLKGDIDLENERRAIVDFLKRLKKYAQDVAVIPDATLDLDPANLDRENNNNVLKYTNHYAADLNRLISEIDIQIREIQEVNCLTEEVWEIRSLMHQAGSSPEKIFLPENHESLNERLDGVTKIVARGMVNLVRLIRGPHLQIGDIWRLHRNSEKNVMELQYVSGLNPNQYVSAITHTEQIVDWLSDKFGGNILVKISGKAPCLKCSHYIQYATKANGNRVKDAWNARTVIGFNVGWKSPDECKKYRYPVKVFNGRPMKTPAEGNWTTANG
ncbi:MAG: hypothetical protein LBI77_03975, partial [Puniceicoccales bacterium]|nr:hypothetical protein [Puniceicoccales bacterium]